MSDELSELAEIARRGLFHEYRESGGALKQIRDGKLYRAAGYASFKAWIEAELECHRDPVYRRIQASEVALDLEGRRDTRLLRLPLRHAVLVWRFQHPDVRAMIAKAIARKSYREAVQIVLALSDELEGSKGAGRRRPEHHSRLTDLQRIFLRLTKTRLHVLVQDLEGFEQREEFAAKLRRAFAALAETSSDDDKRPRRHVTTRG